MRLITAIGKLLGAIFKALFCKSDAEKLGEVEARLETLQKSVEVREAMRKAKKPVTDTELEDLLRSGKLAFLLLFLLPACSASTVTVACPELKAWSQEEQTAMADELLLLPENSVLKSAMKDYAYMRSQIRECRSF